MRQFSRYTWVVLYVAWAASTCAAQADRDWAKARDWMVESEIATAGIKSPAVLAALREVPRHEFVPAELQKYAYFDASLPIGEQQTISPPYIVGWMTQQLDPRPTDRVLEIGTGSGYQAAVLSRLAGQVYTIEIKKPLAERARGVIEHLGYQNVTMKVGDGFKGWPEHAPFDKIIVTCSPEDVPAPLVEQLREGGRMVIPLGQRYEQTLCVMAKRNGKLTIESREPTYFVPMTGQADSLRKSHSDAPLTPLANGDFERILEPGKPTAWFYLRQATIDDEGRTADSPHCLTLTNRVLGRDAQAIQSFGVDGSRVSALDVEVWAKATNVYPSDVDNREEGAGVVVSFFDEQRAPLGQKRLGPWRGSFDWRRQDARIPVPPAARGASVAISMMGCTGELSCDEIQLHAAAPAASDQKP